MHISGLTPKMCLDKYRELKKNNKIKYIEKIQIDESITGEKFVKRLNKTFTSNQEKEILNQIKIRILDGKLVTSKDISTIDFKYYYSPLNLCLKSIIKTYFDKNE